jgi:hypothetical protein
MGIKAWLYWSKTRYGRDRASRVVTRAWRKLRGRGLSPTSLNQPRVADNSRTPPADIEAANEGSSSVADETCLEHRCQRVMTRRHLGDCGSLVGLALHIHHRCYPSFPDPFCSPPRRRKPIDTAIRPGPCHPDRRRLVRIQHSVWAASGALHFDRGLEFGNPKSMDPATPTAVKFDGKRGFAFRLSFSAV